MKVCHVYFSCNRNYGDLVIGETMKVLMRQFLPNANVTTVSPTLGFETANYRRNTNEIVEVANQSDLCVIGGGGLVDCLVGEKPVIPVHQLTCPFIVYSIGFNTFNLTLPSNYCEQLKKIEHKALFFSVRMDGTNRFSGCKYDFRQTVDSAIWVGRFFNDLPRPIKEKYAVVNVAGDCFNYRYLQGGVTKQKLEKICVSIQKSLEKRGYHVISIKHRTTDLELGETVNWKEIMEDFKKGLAYYKHASIVISTRGHSQIIPVGFKVPIINIATQPKNQGFMYALGLEKYCIDINAVTSRWIEKAIKNVEQDNLRFDGLLRLLWRMTVNDWLPIKKTLKPQKVVEIIKK